MFGLNLLLCRICFMVLYSLPLSLSSSGYVVNLVVKYLMAAPPAWELVEALTTPREKQNIAKYS